MHSHFANWEYLTVIIIVIHVLSSVTIIKLDRDP